MLLLVKLQAKDNFHVFEIVQIVQNLAKCLICYKILVIIEIRDHLQISLYY